jgi:Zn-dependent metalloprotease
MSECFCGVLPPYLLQHMAFKSPDARVRAMALQTLGLTENFRGQRSILSQVMPLEAEAIPGESKLTYDARGRQNLPGMLAWQEGRQPTGQREVDEATEGAHQTYALLEHAFGWKSLNGRNMRMVSTARYGRNYNNAFWQGRQMVYGSGDNYIFNRFTAAIDVCGHELTHGVTQFSCGLSYEAQSGALNEHFSDVVGVMVDQWKNGQSADQATWLVGKGLFTSRVQGEALRSMKAPGTAYNDPSLGKDPQPDHMDRLYTGQADNGGVHLNSGPPNKAFYLACMSMGGKAWEAGNPGFIWFMAHTQGGVQPWCDIPTYASITVRKAQELAGAQSKVVDAIRTAWATVGALR